MKATFTKNEFLAIRCEEGFWICRILQNVYKKPRNIKIQWLDDQQVSDRKSYKNIFSPSFKDVIEFDTILSSVNLKRLNNKSYQLHNIEKIRIQRILQQSTAKENGIEIQIGDEGEDENGIDIGKSK